MKEKQYYLYIGKDPENSFTFWLSKIFDDHVLAVVNKDTPDMNVYKVNKESLIQAEEENRLKELNY